MGRQVSFKLALSLIWHQNKCTIRTGMRESSSGSYPIDVWSVGIIMATLLNNGQHPFYDPNDPEGVVKRKISKGELGLFKINCSEGAMNLLKSLLNVYPNERPVAAAALLHPWLSTAVGLSTGHSPSTALLDLTRNEDRISLIFKRLILVAYLRKLDRPYEPLKERRSSTLDDRRLDRRASINLSASSDLRIIKVDTQTQDGAFWTKGLAKTKPYAYSRDITINQDSKKFSISHLKKPVRASNLPEITSVGSPRREKPKILANILDKRSNLVLNSLDERGSSFRMSPDKLQTGKNQQRRVTHAGDHSFFMRQSIAEAKIMINHQLNTPLKHSQLPE